MFNFEQKQERNLEQDKESFLAEVEKVFIQEIGVEISPEIFDAVTANIESTKIFLLGEIHGIKENVDVIYTLFKKFGFKQLALEWETSLNEVVEKYLSSGEIDFNTIEESADGRITAAHFALIKKLTEEGLLNKLVCLIGKSGENTRDENMALSSIQKISDEATLVVAGNLHTKTEKIIFKDGKEMHPMGEFIKKEIPNVETAKIRYAHGEYHNFGTHTFGKEEENPAKAEFSLDEDNVYQFIVPEAHVAVVPNPNKKL